MILSMTGFGEALLEQDGHAYHVEVRSVNNRYLKTSVRLPDDLAFLELEIEQLVRERVSRGSVTLRLYVRDLSEAAAQDINQAAVQHYVQQLRAALPADVAFHVDLGTLAGLPGVCQPHEMSDSQRSQGWEVIRAAVVQALERLVEMRRREGAALAADLQRHCTVVQREAHAIAVRAPLVMSEYRDKLQQRVQRLLADSGVTLAPQDILREAAIFADRCDISEEIARLASHLDQFDAVSRGPEPAGRKLEFIAQELHREANTIGAKSGDVEIARHTIELKSAIDRIKEQVQNVE